MARQTASAVAATLRAPCRQPLFSRFISISRSLAFFCSSILNKKVEIEKKGSTFSKSSQKIFPVRHLPRLVVY
ncbi:hypothetical protein KQI11_00560 [Acetanaerobacterium sp. MSJ-12]|uniref:hypothetical protein n=1 Tax=Oscillospiraceae TaxID=216572 RepID=UPI00163CED70|nr:MULTISPECIES: hypothetical protein [Oscillospiraceae]MBC2870930.1 hypothetical protein [Bittarella massiliensis (ex Durand et al. 2017)]MBU5418613.1 hypothetical protein [Acetanaerobacterium sp. MSJ-12]